MRARASTVIASLLKSPNLSSNPNSFSQLSTPPTVPATLNPTFVRATDATAALRLGTTTLLFRDSLEVKSTVSATPVSPGIGIEPSLCKKFIIVALEEGYILLQVPLQEGCSTDHGSDIMSTAVSAG
jgi:hypothetical protein